MVRQDFLGAAAVRPVAAEASPTTVSFFKGGPEQWRTSVPTAASVGYEGLWPGIDATYAGTGERLKYEFTVAPGADPGAIRLAYRGAERRRPHPRRRTARRHPRRRASPTPPPPPTRSVDGDGCPSRCPTPWGRPRPTASQPYGFALGPYDPAVPLVLDPATIVYAGFIGGGGTDKGFAIAVDGAGAAYVTGSTNSTEATFPEAVGPDLTANGNADAFVAKVAPAGRAWSTPASSAAAAPTGAAASPWTRPAPPTSPATPTPPRRPSR